MHKYRAAARYSAWSSGDEEHPNYNPFSKIRSRSSRRGPLDLEDGLRVSNQSESRITPSIELDRRSKNEETYMSPQHANTMPSGSARLNDPPTTAQTGKGVPDPIEEIQDSPAASETMVAEENSDIDGQARRRKWGFGNKFHKKDNGKDERQRSTSSESKKNHQPFTFVGQLKATIFNSWINILLLMVPVGIAVNYAHLNPIAIFVINFIAIIPLAAMLSYATEEIALRTGETLGGLLNATFGNAVELIVSIIALIQGQVDIVQESLIGSMLSNLLLVMGMCFFFGGVNRLEQCFNVTVAQTASSLLSLAIASLIIPAAFQAWASGSDQVVNKHITSLSRGTAILLLLVYAAYLFFQLKTHADMYNAPSPKTEKRLKVTEGAVSKKLAVMGARSSAVGSKAAHRTQEEDQQADEKEEPQLHIWVAVATLAISTAFVGVCAEYMTASINEISPPDGSGTLSRTFVGLILLPIVGNAAEHATAVTVAIKDKMDLAIGVAVGSSMQIALLVIPFVVVIGWILGNEKMNLAFDAFQIAVLFVSVLLVNYLIQDGKSHWLEGVLLMTLYMIIAIAAWYYPPPPVA